ncbi:MAG: ATP-binding protein [Vulcanimicrobiaceae bacterium]
MNTILPSGTLTFLFTDIEGSTRHWEQHPAEMRDVLARHDALLRGILERQGGYVFKTVGDAFCCAFSDPVAALLAAVEIQKSVAGQTWPGVDELRVRIAVHTGTAQIREGDYFGPALNRTARLLSLVQGGQVVISQTTQRLVREELPRNIELSDLGELHLKDLSLSERAFQLTYPGMLPVFAAPAHAAVRTPNNLPQELSSFVGRKPELQRLHKLVSEKRLLTLVGPGGVGKTRLALHLAREVEELFPGGIYLVELATLADASNIPQAILSAMQVRATQADLVAEITRAMPDRRTLLVLDNSEQFAAECGRLVRRLLEACSTLTIVATSREPLKVAGEYGFSLAPLALPEGGAMTFEQLRKCDAVRLFVERAAAVRSNFKLTPSNADAVSSICRQLDGIPLALELAASRLRTLSAEQIEERLCERFALLTGGDQTGPDHHRTLRSTIDWSFDLLSEKERSLFTRLAIFRGPFTLAAVEATCADERVPRSEILDLMTALIEKSFVTVFEREHVEGYRFLETLQAYATERLDASGESERLAQAHFEYHRSLIERLHAARGDSQMPVLEAIDAAHVDLDAALDWVLEHASSELPALALKLLVFWRIRGYPAEGMAYLEAIARSAAANGEPLCAQLYVNAAQLANAQGENERALHLAERAQKLFELQGDDAGLADAIRILAGIHQNAADYGRAEELFARALEAYKRLGDLSGVAHALTNIGVIETALERFAQAEEHLRSSLAIAAEIQNARLQAWIHGALGYVAHQSNRLAEAMDEYERCLGHFRRLGDKSGIATVLNHLGEVSLMRGEVERARGCVRESLEIASEHRLFLQLADTLEVAARLLGGDGDEAAAARLHGAVDALRERVHFPFTEAELRVREGYINELRARRTGPWFEREREAGKQLELPEALALAKTSAHRTPAASSKKR